VVPDSEVLVHQMVAKELNSSDVCRLIPYATVCGHATAARKHVAEDHEKKQSVSWVGLDDTLEIVMPSCVKCAAALASTGTYGMDQDQFEMYVCRCELRTNF
jgi:hypothetical protein